MSYALFAALSFFCFVVVGYLAQLVKLRQRERAFQNGNLEQHEVLAGLFPLREFISYVAFLLFALSGLTRSYFDYVLVLSRFPVLVLCTVILAILAKHEGGAARRFYQFSLVGDLLFVAVCAVVLGGAQLEGSLFSRLVDWALSGVSFALFYGKSRQALRMYVRGESAAVSFLREFGVILKDATGLAYAISVGPELFWVGLTHVLSLTSSGAIAAVKFGRFNRGQSD